MQFKPILYCTKLKAYTKKTNGLFGRGWVKVTLIINNKRWHTLAKNNENKNKAFVFVIIIKKCSCRWLKRMGSHYVIV